MKSHLKTISVGLSILAVMGLLSLAACGKRPGNVDPPAGVSTEDFPKAYPDISTDPAP
jgi:predicted small lipoprotein YifL